MQTPSTNTPQPTDLLQFSKQTLEKYFETIGEKSFRARQVFQWIYQHRVFDFSKMTNLSKPLREKLANHTTIGQLELIRQQVSTDGTQKLLFRLHDGAQIESVLIPEDKRTTLCISSQVGCALACRFCYTATMGPGRNLSVAEYMGQFLQSQAHLPPDQTISNVVFMGMGEPLVNFDNLLTTLAILTDLDGLAIPSRRLTISTAGLCPQILELGKHFNVRLAISLHATTDTQRNELMPINKRYNLKELFTTLRTFRDNQKSKRLPITLEYTLIDGVNDHDLDARRLAKMARTIEAKINIIPYNEHPGAPYKRPPSKKIAHFQLLLQQQHVRTTRRTTRGDDISAACGQLAIETPSSTPEQQLTPHHRRFKQKTHTTPS